MWRRISPFIELDIIREIDSLFSGTARDASTFTPAVDCFTRDKELVLRAELPGIDPAKVEINVQGRSLTLRGEKQAAHEAGGNDVHYREIVHGRFERTFTLPQGLNVDQVKATYDNGVLEITMPAEGLSTARKVPVEIAA
ncbi:MAG: Hsp20/alpha crystallin family protein [Candidatus Polarisedimenticolia bacterium]